MTAQALQLKTAPNPTSTDYEVKSRVGYLVATYPTQRQAIDHVTAKAETVPGLYVERVERWENRTRVRVRPRLVKS